MRSELYADSKDVWKWSVAIRKAKNSKQVIYWIAMLRPDRGEHGDDERPMQGALPSVAEFFKSERTAHAVGRPPSLARTTLICDREGVDLFCNVDFYPGSEQRRRAYMQNVALGIQARTDDSSMLLFLDPDDGVGERKANGKQIHKSHLPLVWDALRKGDTLGIVQFQHHVTLNGETNSWPRVLQQKIAAAINENPSAVMPHHWDKICIYLIDR